MTFVGHCLVGASLAQAAMPRRASWKQWVVGVNAFVLLAFLPDLPLPGWGHSRYYFSHSLFVNALLIVILAAFFSRVPIRGGRIPPKLLALAALAWLSHFPLDALYNHGQGVAIYWPFSDATLNLPLPWFTTLDISQPLTVARNAHVFLVEAIFYLPLLVVASLLRRIWHRYFPHSP